ncbi:MAG: protealysin inhibitor emfourin [Kineosporiaceae bacterium]
MIEPTSRVRVSLLVRGGFAAVVLARTPPRVVDTADLDDDGAGQLRTLVAAALSVRAEVQVADGEEGVPDAGRSAVPDAVRYRIDVSVDDPPVLQGWDTDDASLTQVEADLVEFVESWQAPAP